MDWATYKSAKYAVEHWHYSKCMPNGKLTRIGVWEDNNFIGVVLFGRGACNHLLTQYGLKITEGCELVRVALDKHKTPVTKIISIAIKMLKKQAPKLKLIVSFADNRQKHLGKIYQAGNWIYTGCIHSTPEYYVDKKCIHERTLGHKKGKWTHVRTININIATGRMTKDVVKNLPKRDGGYRYRYLYPLDKDIKNKIEKLRKPYPKSCDSSLIKTPSIQEGDGVKSTLSHQ